MEVVSISNRHLCQGDFITQLERVSKSGVESIYLREKDLPLEEYYTLAEEFLKVCTECNTYLVQRIDVAKSLGCKSIHLPYGDFLNHHTELDCFTNISVSVHSLEEAKTVQSLGATRLVTGHIFPTDCKKGVPPRGLEYLKTICQSVDVPVYAIGGITPENAHLAISCGAKGVCMMSYLMKI